MLEVFAVLCYEGWAELTELLAELREHFGSDEVFHRLLGAGVGVDVDVELEASGRF